MAVSSQTALAVVRMLLLGLGLLSFLPTANAADGGGARSAAGSGSHVSGLPCPGETAGPELPNIVYVDESANPVAVLVELVGGAGKLDVGRGFAAVDFGDSDQFVSNSGLRPWRGWHVVNTSSGFGRAAVNRVTFGATDFLIRTRDDFAHAGFHVALVAIPGYLRGCPDGLWGHRRAERYLEDIRAVIEELRDRYPDLPVWLVGASRGSVSAASVASRWTPRQGGPDGLVLLSPVTKNQDPASPFATVLRTRLKTIRIPTLIVVNTEDKCSVSPPREVYRIVRRLVSAPRVKVRRVAGGRPQSPDPCGSLSLHDFDGVESQVLKAVTHWIR